MVSTSVGRVHFKRGGSGEPLVLLHGNGQSLHCWNQVFDRLAAHFDVIAWDMPGQGDSEVAARHLSIEDYSDVAVEVTSELGLERSNFLGSSVGGQICAALGDRQPDRVSRLLFVETNFRPGSWWADAWPTVERLFSIPVQDHDEVAERIRQPSAIDVDRWNIDRCKAGGHQMMSVMWAIREFTMEPALQRVRAPSLLLFGADGPAVTAQDDFKQALGVPPTVQIIDESGHFPMIDQPTRFAEAVVTFLQADGSQ